LKARLVEAVGKDAGYTETILKVEAEASSMTYGEMFALCERSIDARTNLIIELRGLYPQVKSDLRTKLIDFLSAENELVRQKSAFYRKSMALSTAMDLIKDHLSEKPSSEYGWDFYMSRFKKLSAESKEAAGGMAEAASAFSTTYKALRDQEATLGVAMEAAGIRFQPIFKKYGDANLKHADEAKALAAKMAA
jgi:hypothetical protein